MSIFARPVSEAYFPQDGHRLDDVEADRWHEAWGYRIAEESGQDEQPVPAWGNTAVFRIPEGGMTEPVFVTKPEHHASFTVSVLAGRGTMIRALASGATELVELAEGGQVVIECGQAYSYVNTDSSDLLLHDVAMPAFQPSDEIKLTESGPRTAGDRRQPKAGSYVYAETPDGNARCVELPNRFYDEVGRAAAGLMRQEGMIAD